tara:strand:- start:7275 stop:7676 length:402 start_codon:yes stop_codon:yes gene_type:complete
MHPNQSKGAASEYTAAAVFSGEGWEIFWPPTGSGAVDFVAVRQGESKKVQVKSAHWVDRPPSRTLRVCIKTQRRRYTEGDFDCLAAVGPDGRVWVIPYEELPDTAFISLERLIGDEIHDYGRSQWIMTTNSNS